MVLNTHPEITKSGKNRLEQFVPKTHREASLTTKAFLLKGSKSEVLASLSLLLQQA
jgi:hypothetical protein